MHLDRLAAIFRGHRYLPRSVGPGAAALAVVPALADGLALPADREASIPAHALDAMAPAAERMLSALIADLDANVSEPGDRSFDDDPFVAALRDTILAGAAISDAAGALALLQAARTCADALAQPPVRLLPLIARFQEGAPDVRGPALAGLVRGIQARVAQACAGAARAGWRMPGFASDLLGCRLVWLFGRGSLDVDPQLPVVAAILGVTVPTTLVAAAERAVRLVVSDVIARRAARKSRPEDQLLLLRWLTPELIALGVDTCGRVAVCDPDLVSAVLPQLATFADAKALAKAGIDRSIADQLVRPEAGVAAASALSEIGAELRRWDVHSCLTAALTRVDARASLPIQAFGPRRRVLQGAIVAAISRPGAPPEGILRGAPPPDTALVAEHGSFALVAFADPVEAVRWALALVAAQGDLLSVGVGAGRLNGGTDGFTTTLQGPAVQGALAAVRRGALGMSAAAAEELVQACPSPNRAGGTDGGLSCVLDGQPLRLEIVGGMTGVFQVEVATAVSTPLRPTRLTPEVELLPEPAPPPRPMPDLLAPRGALPETTGPGVIPAPLRRPSLAGSEPIVRPPAAVLPPVVAVLDAPEENPFDDNTPTPPPTRLASLGAPPPFGDPFAKDAPSATPSGGDDTFWDETPTRVQPAVRDISPAVLAAPTIEIPMVPEFVAPPSLMEPIEALQVPAVPDLDGDTASIFDLPVPVAPRSPVADDGPLDWEAPTAAELATVDPAEDTNDYGTFDFNFDFDESDSASSLEMGGRRVAAVEPLAALVLERTEDDATHVERSRADEGEDLEVPPLASGFSFDLEVEETEDEVSGLPATPPVDDREVHDGSFQFPFAMVDELVVPPPAASDGFALGPDLASDLADFQPPTSGPDAELTDMGFQFPDSEVRQPEAAPDAGLDFDFGFTTPAPVVPTPPVRPAAPTPEPVAPPVSRRKASVAVDFDHLFRGYCFYLDDINAVFGRPYGGRMVDRHQYPYTGDIEQVYRNFLQDKIREGFVPQTDLTGDVPATMTLLPLNSERLQRAWGVLT